MDALTKLTPKGTEIDVVTTLPQQSLQFCRNVPLDERQGEVAVFRIALPKWKGGILIQSIAFLVYFFGVIRTVSGKDYDLVFATSGRLMTAVLGAWIAHRKSARLYLDIRDIFVDNIKEMLPRGISYATRPIFGGLERWAIMSAHKVNLVSAGFAKHFTERYPQQKFSYFTNGIDDEFMESSFVQPSVPIVSPSQRVVTVLYAGNIGDGQGLHRVIPELAKRMGSRIRFKIIGDGNSRRTLMDALVKENLVNVELVSPMSREELIDAYRAADVLFLHLNAYSAFETVLPSKIFEYGALGKPIWAGVAGYPAEFIKAEISNAGVFTPCDAEDAGRAFEKLVIADVPRADFVKKFSRATISQELAQDIMAQYPAPRLT